MRVQMQKNVGVYGLGSMGFGMAQSLLRAGHHVFGHDIRPEPVARLSAEGGQQTDNPGLFDAVCLVVLNAKQTEAILFGEDGIAASLRQGAVVISCATVAPEFASEMEARCAAYGVHYLDAPISGGSVKAAEGALSIMAAGTKPAFEAARPVLSAICENLFELGDKAGAGSVMKSVNQLLAGVHIAAMAEALTFGVKQGLEPSLFLEVISQCAGTSWMLENRAPHIIAGDYTPHSAVNIWLKDLGIVQDVARDEGVAIPLARAALAQFTAAAEMGCGGEDDAAVAKVYARDAAVTLPSQS